MLDGSLSARRAWIEICQVCVFCRVAFVALRKESVDRNSAMQIVIIVVDTSLSARRAWIEISGCWLPDHSWWSLSARRAWIEISIIIT